LLSINHAQIAVVSQKHGTAGRLMSEFKTNIDTPIAAILILNTTAHTVGAAVAGASYIGAFGEKGLWLFTLIFTLVVLLFTEIVPKTMGVAHASRLAVPAAYGIRMLTFVLKPLVSISGQISTRLRGGRAVPVTSLDEIRLLAALGRNEGIVGARTAEMIVGATLLKKLRALDVLIPRPRVVFISTNDSRDQIHSIMKETMFSRFPLSSSSQPDDIFGMVLSRDLLFWMQEHPDEEIHWPDVTIDALFVPESTPLNVLLKTFQTERRHMAIVVDEFGGIEGVATLEDVIEEVIGEIDDESDEPTNWLWRQPDGSLHAQANSDLRRVCTVLGLDWSPEAEVTTLGGLLSEKLGHIPRVGDCINWRGHLLEVLTADSRQAKLVRILQADTGQESN
jgi:CBS domain containing-hemolysin-like protein